MLANVQSEGGGMQIGLICALSKVETEAKSMRSKGDLLAWRFVMQSHTYSLKGSAYKHMQQHICQLRT